MGSAMPAWVAHSCPAWRQGMITAKASHRAPGVCQRRAQGVPRVLDVHFISSLPVMLGSAYKAWVDSKLVQMVWGGD